jgi:hypothetical protein
MQAYHVSLSGTVYGTHQKGLAAGRRWARPLFSLWLPRHSLVHRYVHTSTSLRSWYIDEAFPFLVRSTGRAETPLMISRLFGLNGGLLPPSLPSQHLHSAWWSEDAQVTGDPEMLAKLSWLLYMSPRGSPRVLTPRAGVVENSGENVPLSSLWQS